MVERQLAQNPFTFDWRVERGFRVPNENRDTLGLYYIFWDSGSGMFAEGYDAWPRDECGIIKLPEAGVGHPIHIAQYALHLHEQWLREGNDLARQSFLSHAAWLRDHQVTKDGIEGRYEMPIPCATSGSPAGWISGMAQGEAISALLRASELRPGEGFREAAFRAASPFTRTLAEGGVVWRGKDRTETFFEKAAVEPPVHVLSATMFALFGLFDLMCVGAPSWVENLFADGIATLSDKLVLFDSGYWSYATLEEAPGLPRRASTFKEHITHVAQLRVLCGMTGDGYFARMAGDWARYRLRFTSRAWFIANRAVAIVTDVAKSSNLRGDGVARG